jgi:hypothetical protein
VPELQCGYDLSRGTYRRGRVSTKVRFGPITLLLDVPDYGDLLLAWAAEVQQRLAASIVFYDAAYCIGYTESFVDGDTGTGAYKLELTLADPDGYTLAPGGPVACVPPTVDEHSGLPAALA